MRSEFYLLLFLTLVLVFWSITIVTVSDIYGTTIHGHTSTFIVTRFATIYDIEKSKVVLYKHIGHERVISDAFMLSGGRWSVGARPISGDHIHSSISFWVDNRPLPAQHDRKEIENISYESKPTICQEVGPVAYTKLWPHAGVHTHCDGLIHVHPWSAPTVIRKEGLDIRLQMWFDQVGIKYREFPEISLTFKDGHSYSGNSTHRWAVAEKKCFNDKKISRVYYERINQIWLGNAYASYVVWYGRKDSKPPNDIDSHINNLKKVAAVGYNGQTYPHMCELND